MINVKLDHPWYSMDWLNKLDYDQFKKFWPIAPEEKPEAHVPESMLGPCRVTYEEANNLVALGLKLDLIAMPSAMLTKLRDNKTWDHGQEILPKDLVNGDAIQITIPDQALLWIDEVTWLEDACTNDLQGQLDDGWRILAVCPPNASRRPDYILGRRKEGPDPFDNKRNR